MKKLVLVISLILVFTGYAFAAQSYHLYFAVEKTSHEIPVGSGNFYDAWKVANRHYILIGDPEPTPHDPSVYKIVKRGLLASAGDLDLIWVIERGPNAQSIAIAGAKLPEYMGGGIGNQINAWITFVVMSIYQKNAHDQWTPGAAAKLVLNARWSNDNGETWKNGSFGELVADGFSELFTLSVPLTISD